MKSDVNPTPRPQYLNTSQPHTRHLSLVTRHPSGFTPTWFAGTILPMLGSLDTHALDIAANLDDVRARIAAACRRAGRNPDEVTLVVVSKTQPMAAIQAALAHGQHDFGENRFEEVASKIALAHELRIDDAIRWHFIGNIQSRKSAQAIGPFALIHAVDRLKIAERLSRDALQAGCVLSVLLEVNVSGEESKHGFSADELRQALPQLAQLAGLRIQGLMTMAPLMDDPQQVRPTFRSLRLLRAELAATTPQVDWRHLSMGMTNDFEVAIEEGATIVRIGTAIFGDYSARNQVSLQ